MKTLTAKTLTEVRNWLEENPHHYAEALNSKKRTIQTNDEGVGFFLIGGRNGRIYIPAELNTQCFLTPYLVREGFMYRWDYLAESIAPLIGSYVTTNVSTYTLDEKRVVGAQCGVRQGILTGVDYMLKNPDDENSTEAFLIVKGQLGRYAMTGDADALVVVDDNSLFGESVQQVIDFRKKNGIALGVLNE